MRPSGRSLRANRSPQEWVDGRSPRPSRAEIGCDAGLISQLRVGPKLLGLDRYRGPNANFVRVVRRAFEADGVNKVVEIVHNALVEAVELRSFIGLEADIAF